jgi:hypothetical protein
LFTLTIVVLFHCFRRLKAEKDRSHGTDPIGKVSRMWSKLMSLTIATMTPAEITRVFGWYSADLPQNATFQQEIHRWSTFCQDLKHRPSSLSDAFLLAHPNYYPNIREIFHIFYIIPRLLTHKRIEYSELVYIL